MHKIKVRSLSLDPHYINKIVKIVLKLLFIIMTSTFARKIVFIISVSPLSSPLTDSRLIKTDRSDTMLYIMFYRLLLFRFLFSSRDSPINKNSIGINIRRINWFNERVYVDEFSTP